MDRNDTRGSSRVMASAVRRAWLASLAVLLACWLMPSLAQAQAPTTVTLGPAMTNAGADESCPTMPGGGPPVAFPDCAYVNSSEPAGVIAQAPADGTITTWRIDGFQGTARLLVLQATGGGGYEVVQRSLATPDEPCVNSGSFCGPSLSPYVFTTNLPIKQGQYIGVEGISGANCDGTPDMPNPCTFIGIGPTGSASEYFDTTPALNTPTAPSGNDTGRLVNADEVVGNTPCKVPKLAGKTLKAAQRALAKAHCQLGKVSYRKSSKVPAGKVISSNPKRGTRKKAKARVGITISGKAPVVKVQCVVPKLAGATLTAAKSALGRAHCKLGKVTKKKSAKVGKGGVIASSPGKGSKRKSGTRVNLTLSRGKH